MKKSLLRLFFLILLIGVGRANANTYFVQHHGDAPNNGFALFNGSLREAIVLANGDNTATFGSPHIIIDTVTTSSSITLTSQLPNINEDMIILGANNSSGLLTVKAFNPIAFNIFNIGSISGFVGSQYVELNNIRIQNGFTVTLGGGINVQNCTLTLNNCELLNNSNFNGLGGAIYAGDAALNINNSTIANNSINNGNGAGIFFGGVFGSLNIINSTITGNTAISGSGGGVDFNSSATINVISSTIVGNTAVDGGGIFINQNQFFLENSIVLNNIATNTGNDIYKGTSVDLIPGINSLFGHNIVGDNNGFTTNSSAVLTGNISPADISQVVSSTLANNGGRTQTLMPTPCSPSIDAGVSVNPPTTDNDQRGTALTNLIKDIGAVEYPSVIVTDQTSCGPAIFTITATGGTSTTQPIYNWYHCESCATVVGTGASFTTGTISAPDSFYVAEVTSCASPKRYKVHVTVFPIPPTPTVAISGFPANTTSIQLCVGSTAVFTSSAVSTGIYAWTPNGELTQAITVGAAGSYVVTITDVNNCTKASNPVTVTMIPQPNVPVITSSIGGSGTAVCATDTAKLTATTSSTPIGSYEWFLNTTTTNVTIDNIDAAAEGDYTVTVTSIPGCSSTSAPFTINHNPLPAKPTLTVGGPTTFCIGGFVQLISSDAINTNTWNTIPAQTGTSINVDTTGNIFATVTDGNNCKNYSDTVAIVVNIPTKPTVTISNAHPTTFCDGDSIVLTASASASYAWSNGATTQTITVKVSTANLAVTTTDINGCSATSDSLQITVIPITTPVITALGATTFCDGGSVTLESDQPINNTWTPGGATTTSITVTTSGNYYVLIPGCSDTSNVVTVTVNPNPVEPTISNNTPLTFCDGDSVILVANSPESNLTYLWTAPTANTNDSLTVKSSGSYSVTVSNTFGCSATSLVTAVNVLTLPAAPIVTPSGPLSFCEGDSVRLTSSISTNNLWSTGETTQSILVTTSGDYFVKVSDANNCLSLNSDTFTVDVKIPVKPFITADDTLTFCDGDSVHLTSSIATDILWSNGSTAQTITVFASGTFHVEALDLGNGCTGKSRDTIVTVLPTTQPVISATTPTVFCIGGNVVLTSSSPAGNQWFESGNPIVGQTGNTLNVTTNGNYTVSLPGCALQSVAVPVTVNPLPAPPIIIAAGPTTFCADKSVTLASSYTDPGNLWNTGATTQSIVSTTAQTYTVTYTDGNGCTSLPSLPTTTNTLALPTKPIITTGSTLDVFCTGGTIDLISSYTFNNAWSSTPTNNDTITVNASGTYTVTHTDANGCTATSDPKVINEVQPFTPTITLSGNDTICEGQSLTLTSSEPFGNQWSTGDTTQSITISQPGNYNVLLQSCDLPSDSIKVAVLALPTKPNLTLLGANPICQGDSSLLVSDIDNVSWSITSTIGDSLYAKTAGDYYAINTDLFGCVNYSDTILINVTDTPIVVLTTPPAQCGGTLTFDAGYPGSTYLWSNGATTQTVTVSAGIALNVSVTNTCGTFTSNTINVPINAIPVVALGIDILQCGGSVTLDAQNAGANFAWSTSENTQTISVSTTGTYSVTVTTAAGCSASDNINVNVDGTFPAVALGNDVAQCGGTVTLNVGNPLSTYQWNTVGSATVLGTQATFTAVQTGNYVASVTNGCGTRKDTILVTINPIPVVAISPITNACNTLVTLNAGNLGSTFVWSPNGETTQAITVSTSGTYSVVVTNPQGCSASASSNVTISTSIPVVNLGADGDVCATSVLLDAANVGSTYTWVLPDNSIVNTQTVNATTSGTYAVLVNNGCGIDRDTITINLLTPVTVNIGGPYTTCAVPVNLTAAPQPNGSSFVWKKDGNPLSFTTDNITVNATGDYQVIVTNSVGCSNSSTAQVEIDAPLVAPVLTAPTSNCGTFTINIGTIASTTVATWFDVTNTQVGTGNSLNITTSGTYHVTLTNFCGSVTSNSVTILILPAPTTNLGGPYNTCITPVTLDATAQLAGTTFVWTLNNGVVADSVSQTFTANISGTYGVTVTNSAGCSATSSAQVTIDQPLTAQTISAPAINCGSFTINAGAYAASTTYQWFNGSSPIANANSSTFVATVDGVYSVSVSNNCGSATSNAVTIQILPAVTVDLAGPYNTCQNPVTLSAGTQLAGSTFVWTQDGSALAVNSSSIVASATAIYGVTVTNSAGCSATSTAAVTIDSPLTPPVISAPAVNCGSFTINAGTFAPSTTIQWLDAANNVVANTASFTITTSGTYSVSVANNCGGGTSNSVTIDILPAVTVDLGAAQTTCATPVTLDAGAQSVGSTFVWTKNSQVQPEITGTLIATTTGLYAVTVTNTAGCSATSSANITIDNLPATPVLATPPTNCAITTLDAGLYPVGTSYTWTSTVTNTVLGNSQTVAITQTDEITVTLANSCGAVTSNIVHVEILQAPTVDLGNAQNTCDTPVILDAGVQDAGSTYAWFNGAAPIANETNQTYLATVTGNYTATVTNVAGCSTSSSVQVIIDSPLLAPALAAQLAPTCATYQLCAGTYPTNTTYEWFEVSAPAAVLGSANCFAATTTGTYGVRVFNNCGSTTSNTVAVTIIPAPTVNIGGPFNTCDTPVLLNAGGQATGSTFIWFSGSTPIAGETGQTYLATVSGNYTVTITNAANCSTSSTAQVTIDSPLLAPVLAAQTAPSCATYQLCAGTYPPSTTYEWFETSAPSLVIGTAICYTATTSGTYGVRVFNNCGSTTSNTVAVSIIPAPIVDLGIDRNTCNTPVVLNVGTQANTSTIAWFNGANVINGQTNQTYTATVTGNYTATVTNAAGCSTTDVIVVTIDSPLSAPVLSGPTTPICGSTQACAGIYPATTTYAWFETSAPALIIGTSNCLDITVSGTYAVTVTNNCGSTTSNSVAVTILPAPVVDLGVDKNTCDTPVLLNAGVQPSTSIISWYNGSTIIAGETTETYTATTTGNYIAEVTNAAGCSTIDTVAVTIDSPLSAPVLTGPTAAICASQQVCAGTYPASTTYEWFETSAPAAVLGTSNCFDISITGNYGVRVSNNCGSTTSNTISVTIIPAPVVALGIDKNTCDTPVTLDAGLQLGTSTIVWFNGASVITGETSQTYTATVTGTYIALVTNAAGCSSNDTVNVTIDSPLTAPTLAAPANSCTSATFDAGSSYPASTSFEWFETTNPLTVLGTNSTYTTTVSGTFGVRVFNNCGSSTSNTVAVTIFTNPTVNIGNNLTQCGGTVDLIVSSSFASYLWNDATASNNDTLVVTNTGTYSVLVTDANGCTAQSNTVSITINPVPTVSLGNDIAQCGGTTILSTTPAFNSYNWNTAPVSSAPTIIVSTSGEYIVVVTDANGCIATDTVNVFIDAPFITPVLTTPAPSCATTILDAGAYPIGTTYSWINNINNVVGNQQILTLTATDTVSVIVSNSCGVDTSNTVIAIVIPAPIVDLAGPYQTCNTPVTLDAGTQDAASTLAWSNIAGIISGATSQTFTANTTDLYTVTVTNAAGCSTSSTAEVTIDLPLVAPVLASPAPSCTDIVVSAGTYPASTQFSWFDVTNPTVILGTTPTFTVTSTTDIAVTVYNQCDTLTSNTITVTILPVPTVNLAGPYNSCIIPVTLDAGAQPLGATYAWASVANGTFADSTSQTFIASVSGSYTVTVTNAAGCTASSTAQVTIDGLLAAPVLVAPAPACLSTILDAGSYPATTTYAWFNTTSTTALATTATFTATVSGDYFVTVTNNCGTTTSDTISVIINPLPVVNIGTDAAQCGGTLTLDAGVGVSYLWNDVAATSTQTLAVSNTGSYSVVVTDGNGCSGTSNIVNITINTPPTVSLGNNIIQCGGTVTLSTTPTFVSYVWSNGPITPTSVVSATGSYNVLVTDVNNCTATDTIVVTIDAPLNAPVLTAAAPSCTSITLDAGTYPTGTSFEWFETVGTANVSVGTAQTLVADHTGSYFVTVTQNCGSVTSNTVALTIDLTPVVTLTTPAPSCGGTTLSAGTQASTTTYAWTRALDATFTANTNSINATVTDNYTVVVTNSLGCSATSSAVVSTSLALPVVSFAPTLTSCGPITLDAQNVGSTYAWFNVLDPINNIGTTQTLQISSTGSYYVVVTNNCGSVTSNTSNVTVNPAVITPVVTANGPTTFCTGGSVILSAPTVSAGSTYTWIPGGQNTQTITVTATNAFAVVITNAQGCSATSPLTLVNVGSTLTPPVITASGATSFCPGGSVILTSSYATGNTWHPYGQLDQSIVVQTDTIITVSVVDAFGCTATSAPISVNVFTAPIALITANQPSVICTGEIVTLWSTTGNGYNYSWFLNNGTTSISTDSMITVNQTQGPLSYTVSITDANGCSTKSPTYTFNYKQGVPQPKITATPSSKTCDGTVTLTSDASTGNIWFNGATSQSITINKLEHAWVRVENSNGCQKTSDTSWFDANEGTPIELTYKVSEYYDGKFNVSEFDGKNGWIDITTNGGISPLTYSWTQDSSKFTFSGEDLTNVGEGTYYITVNDKYGCKVSDTITLKAPFEFKLPSGISPNGDGNNDVYIIGSIEKYPNNKVQIYNRWGGIVFSIDGYNNVDKIWTGTNNDGNELPEGTYYVVLTFPDGKAETLNKYVDLKR